MLNIVPIKTEKPLYMTDGRTFFNQEYSYKLSITESVLGKHLNQENIFDLLFNFSIGQYGVLNINSFLIQSLKDSITLDEVNLEEIGIYVPKSHIMHPEIVKIKENIKIKSNLVDYWEKSVYDFVTYVTGFVPDFLDLSPMGIARIKSILMDIFQFKNANRLL